jgi:hypothetical protein
VIDRETFAEGIMRLAVAARAQDVNRGTVAVYFDALGPQTTADEWRALTLAAVASGRFRYFPTVRELLDALREHRGERAPEVEATDAYERVLGCGTYTAEGGTSWTFRAVKEACGVAAAEAFLAAGGDSAFRTTWDEAKRRERFTRAYAEAVRCDASTRLLPAGPTRALASGEERGDPSREDAGRLLRFISERAGR